MGGVLFAYVSLCVVNSAPKWKINFTVAIGIFDHLKEKHTILSLFLSISMLCIIFKTKKKIKMKFRMKKNHKAYFPYGLNLRWPNWIKCASEVSNQVITVIKRVMLLFSLHCSLWLFIGIELFHLINFHCFDSFHFAFTRWSKWWHQNNIKLNITMLSSFIVLRIRQNCKCEHTCEMIISMMAQWRKRGRVKTKMKDTQQKEM